jgi:hypothetical protein
MERHMAAPEYTYISFEDGVRVVRLGSWRFYQNFIMDKWQKYKQYVYRGQRDSTWPLQPTLDRLLQQLNMPDNEKTRKTHLEQFRRSARCRRGSNPRKLKDNELWALGRHYGLATPLLDWTEAPYLALFFAFEEPDKNAEFRAVWALSKNIRKRYNEIEFIEPNVEDNPRLVSQAGLFTLAPAGIDLETWIKSSYQKELAVRLLKIEIPNSGRDDCLRYLNRMNINYLSLFPDLFGSAEHANLSLQISNY